MSTQPVAGVWKRLWEEDPLGDSEGADRDTLVLWTQAPKSGIYVDIRLPFGSPGRSLQDARAAGYKLNPSALEAKGLVVNDYKIKQADVLFRQKSFAGTLSYTVGDTTSGDAIAKDKVLAHLAAEAKDGALGLCTCFWRRDIDYQPPSGGLDIGVCASEPPNADGSIDLRETGDDASYAEGWHRLPGSAEGPSFALKLVSESDTERTGFWVRTGDEFAYAIGRPKNDALAEKLGCLAKSAALEDCVGKSLREAAKSVDDDLSNQLRMVGSYIGLHGRVANGEWIILHSTEPDLVGCSLVGLEGSSSCCSTLGLDGENKLPRVGDILTQSLVGPNGVVRKWEILEIDGTSHLPGIE